MKILISVIFNFLHIYLVWGTGNNFQYANNALNIMNFLAILSCLMYLIAAFAVVNEAITEEKVVELYNKIKPNSFMFKLRNILYYMPMVTLTLWFELYGTLAITGMFLISMFIFLLCIQASKELLES